MVGQTGSLIFPVAPHTLLRANRPASCRNPLTPTTNPRKEHTQIDGTHHLRRRHPHQRRGDRLHKSRKENIRRPVRVPRIPIRPKQTLHKKGTPTPILRNQGPSKGDQTMTTRRLVTPKDNSDSHSHSRDTTLTKLTTSWTTARSPSTPSGTQTGNSPRKTDDSNTRTKPSKPT